MLGLGVASASAWFGGHLAYRRGIGVNRTAFDTVPAKWQDVLDEGDLAEGKLVGASVGGMDVLLVRQGQTIHAMDDRCAHLGCSLHKGKLADGVVVCPCHGSAFALDGTVVHGPATADQPALDTRVQGGKVQVRRRGGRR
jgi:nitrite reductase/ring-hydroxylating ferredoxin subunit